MSLRKILQIIIYGGFFLLPVVPLIVTGTLFFPFITGKAFFFRIIVEIMLAAWLGLVIFDSEYRPRRSLIFIGSLLALIILTLSTLVASPYTFKAFWSNFERMEGLLGMLHVFGYIFVVGSAVRKNVLWRWFFRTSIAVSGIVGIYAFLQLTGRFAIHQGSSRVDATFGNATYLASYMLFHIFITLLLIYKDREKYWTRYIYGLFIILQIATLYYTGTRGAILGLFGGLFIATLIVALYGKKKHPRLWKGSTSAVIGLIILAGIFIGIRDTAIVEKSGPLARLASISLTERTVQSRFLIWSIAWEGIQERPILGWGQEGFIYVFGKYYDPQMYNQEPWFDRAHNVLFDWLIFGGFPALVAYLFLFIGTLWYVWKKDYFSIPERALITGILLGYLFHNMFVFDNTVSYWLFGTVLAYVHVRTVYPESSVVENTAPIFRMTPSKMASSIVTVMIFAGVVYTANIRPIRAAGHLIDALSPRDNPIDNLVSFENAISLNTIGLQEAREQLSQGAAVLAGSTLPQETKDAILGSAKKQLDMQIADDPQNPRNSLFAGSMLRRAGRYTESLSYIEKARALSPKKQHILFELGSAYLGLNDYENAFLVLKEAYELAPEYEAAQFTYATAAVYAGRMDIVEEVLVPVFGTITPGADVSISTNALLNAYAETNQYDKVLQMWEERLSYPQNESAELRVGLSATYLQVGDRKNAILQLERAIELEPAFKEQGEYFIREIRAGRDPRE